MYKKFYLFVKLFFIAFGLESLIFVIINLISPEIFTIKFLWAFGVCGLISTFCGSFIYKKGVSQKSLWIRRAIMIGISCITCSTVFILTISIKIKNLLFYIMFIILAIVVLSCIAYIIADKAEKKILCKINAKLEQNK